VGTSTLNSLLRRLWPVYSMQLLLVLTCSLFGVLAQKVNFSDHAMFWGRCNTPYLHFFHISVQISLKYVASLLVIDMHSVSIFTLQKPCSHAQANKSAYSVFNRS